MERFSLYEALRPALSKVTTALFFDNTPQISGLTSPSVRGGHANVLNTTMRSCEIKWLRWSDVDLLKDTLNIRKSKTEAGVRVIPLTPNASEVLAQLRKRSETFGPVESGRDRSASVTVN
jgi:integrase